jgi:hypothetical protein
MIGVQWGKPAPEREECPIHGCGNSKPDRQIMCSTCFASIPRKARDLVERASKSRNVPGRGTRDYRNACTSAIAAAQAVRS